MQFTSPSIIKIFLEFTYIYIYIYIHIYIHIYIYIYIYIYMYDDAFRAGLRKLGPKNNIPEVSLSKKSKEKNIYIYTIFTAKVSNVLIKISRLMQLNK